ncbi:hypothetical protein ES703_81474 [subsurface metagenome]
MAQDATVITFTDLIAAGALNNNNWFVRHANAIHVVTGANVFEGTVVLSTVPGVADPGPDVVSFDPPPFDVISDRTGLAALAFADFPLT